MVDGPQKRIDPKKRIELSSAGGNRIEFEVDGVPQRAHKTWFRGDHCNFNPNAENMKTADAICEQVLAGWIPAEPTITHKTNIVAFGSCFAENITYWLSQRNFNVLTSKDGDWGDTYIVRFGEGMVNSFAIRQQFEWAFEGKEFADDLWHGYDAAAQGYDETIRKSTRDVFMAADFFIITLGLSEVWSNKKTGDVFWRAVPEDKYDPSRHEFRVSTHKENQENIAAIYKLIRKHRPDAKIMFTLSPVPLVATFRPVSCITANSVSKAILRSALDEFLREHQPQDQDLHYWPSYEIVMDVFADRWRQDRRHVKREILDYIMTMFEHVWCMGKPQMGLGQAWVRARCATGTLPGDLYPILEAGKTEVLRAILAKLEPADAELVRQVLQEMAAGVTRDDG